MVRDCIVFPACWLVTELPDPCPPREGIRGHALAVAPAFAPRGVVGASTRRVLDLAVAFAGRTAHTVVLRHDLTRTMPAEGGGPRPHPAYDWDQVVHELSGTVLPAIRFALPAATHDALVRLNSPGDPAAATGRDTACPQAYGSPWRGPSGWRGSCT